MRVYIGPYPKWFSTEKLESKWLEWRHKKPVWDISESEYTKLDRAVVRVLDAWQTVLNCTVNKIQEERNRTEKVRIHDWDIWNADRTMALVILPLLKELKDAKQGTPIVDLEDVPKELHPTKKQQREFEKTGTTDEKFQQRWDYVLDAMIWSFQEIVEDLPGEDQFVSGESDIVWTKVDAQGNEVGDDFDGVAYSRMSRGPNDTFKIDSQGLDEYHNRIKYGTTMFGKYFTALWT